MLTGLDIAGRAALLGITCREAVALGQRDRRIYPSVQSAGSVARLQRWIGAGQPAADLPRLEFAGDDGVRAIVVDVLRRVPAPIAWHAVEHVTWIECGRCVSGWMGAAPRFRQPDDDVAHVIVLNGTIDDAQLASIAAHELGHAWDRPIYSGTRDVRISRDEERARELVVERVVDEHLGITDASATHDRLVRAHVADERRADELATLWGFPRHTDVDALTRHFRREYAASATLADQIERDIEHDIQGAA